MARKTLTDKQRVFLEEYLGGWNATEAARKAGYAFPNVEGPKNLVNPSIQQVIAARIAELTMSANEVLIRLTEHARSSMEEFVNVDQAALDLKKARSAGKLHLIKKFTRSDTKYGKQVSIELYDQQAALALLAKHHGLFVERHEHSGTDGQPLQPPTINVAVIDYRAAGAPLAPLAAGPVDYLPAPGEGESAGDGPEVGKVDHGRVHLPDSSERGR